MRVLFRFALLCCLSFTPFKLVQGSQHIEYLDFVSLSYLKFLPAQAYQGFESVSDSGKTSFRFVIASNLDGKHSNSIRSRGLNIKRLRNWGILLGGSYLAFRIANAIYFDPKHLHEARKRDHTILYPQMTHAFNTARSDYLDNGGPSEAELYRDLKSIPRNSPAFIARMKRYDREEKKKWNDLPQFEKDLEAKVKADAAYDDAEKILKEKELRSRKVANFALLAGALGAGAEIGLNYFFKRLSVVPQIERIERKILSGEVPILWIDPRSFEQACSELTSSHYAQVSLDVLELFLFH